MGLYFSSLSLFDINIGSASITGRSIIVRLMVFTVHFALWGLFHVVGRPKEQFFLLLIVRSASREPARFGYLLNNQSVISCEYRFHSDT